MISKQALREKIKTYLKNADTNILSYKSEIICNLIEQHFKFVRSQKIALYYPLSYEVNIVKLINNYALSKNILLPVIVQNEILFRQYLYQPLKKGPYGIMEPSGTEYYNFNLIDLIIMPGLAFDNYGYRLGHGKGYYDRLLSKINTYKIGICFDFQFFKNIPHDPNDQRVDEVIYA